MSFRADCDYKEFAKRRSEAIDARKFMDFPNGEGEIEVDPAEIVAIERMDV